MSSWMRKNQPGLIWIQCLMCSLTSKKSNLWANKRTSLMNTVSKNRLSLYNSLYSGYICGFGRSAFKGRHDIEEYADGNYKEWIWAHYWYGGTNLAYCLINILCIGVLEEDWWRHGQDKLLLVLCDAGCRHKWKPKQSEQLLIPE